MPTGEKHMAVLELGMLPRAAMRGTEWRRSFCAVWVTDAKNLFSLAPKMSSQRSSHTAAQSSMVAWPPVRISASASRCFMMVSSVPSSSKSSIQPCAFSTSYGLPSAGVPMASPIRPPSRQPRVLLNRVVVAAEVAGAVIAVAIRYSP